MRHYIFQEHDQQPSRCLNTSRKKTLRKSFRFAGSMNPRLLLSMFGEYQTIQIPHPDSPIGNIPIPTMPAPEGTRHDLKHLVPGKKRTEKNNHRELRPSCAFRSIFPETGEACTQ